MNICKVKECNSKHYALGYCSRHYRQIKKYNKILRTVRFDGNEIINCKNYVEIVLCDKKHKRIAKTKIDKDDLEKVKKYKWYLNLNSYVCAAEGKKQIRLHRLILGSEKGLMIDHRDGDSLNNLKKNLRHCTNQQNSMNNKSKGYCWNKKNKKWTAQIAINNKQIYLGSFNELKDAKDVREQAKQKYFKEFAYKF